LLPLSLLAVDTQCAAKDPDHAADCASQHATDGSGSLVAGLGAVLHAFYQPLGLRSSSDRKKYHHSKAQPWQARGCWRVEHDRVSSANL
jgi:hypothetical protein